ncbi:MAG: redoxin family protein [Rickettsiales bacterium]|nr:redoxin family protein [Rickettsiales bacterium]
MNKFLPFILLLSFIVMIGVSTYKINARQHINKEEKAEKNLPTIGSFVKADILLPDFSLPNLYDENSDFSKKDLLGKYSVINIFASWCTTCKAEHEILMRLKQERIVDVYGIAWRDINENTKSYLKDSGNPFIKVASDNKALFSKIIGIRAVPETLIINGEGRVVRRYQGNLQDFSIDEIRDFLKKG